MVSGLDKLREVSLIKLKAGEFAPSVQTLVEYTTRGNFISKLASGGVVFPEISNGELLVMQYTVDNIEYQIVIEDRREVDSCHTGYLPSSTLVIESVRLGVDLISMYEMCRKTIKGDFTVSQRNFVHMYNIMLDPHF